MKVGDFSVNTQSLYQNKPGLERSCPDAAVSQEAITEKSIEKTLSEDAPKEEKGASSDKKYDTPLSYLDDPALKQMVAELKARDSEVRAHEAAHIAAGGGIVKGGANFTYQKAPDGRLYAIGGEVPIDASEESTPEATIQKMQQVRSAAMAPSNPSATDYKVAANAMMAEMKARQELAAEEMDQTRAQNGLDIKA
jgi:hypothetical protein